MTKTLTESDLRQFIGTEQYYRYPLTRDIVYTDGVRYMADHGGAYWLIDEIALAQTFEEKVKAEPFQSWKLTVKDHTADLVCEDGDYNVVYRKHIPFTDFPLPEIQFFVTNNVIMLTSEY